METETKMANESGRKLRGRKLILNWGNLKMEISKLPNRHAADTLIFDLFGSDVLLANVYETPDGHLEDEILGKPAGWRGDGTMLEGYRIGQYVTDNGYWKTIGEANSSAQCIMSCGSS